MNRPKVIFILLSFYILAAFGWWTYAHYLNSQTIAEKQKEITELSCYKATFDIQGAIDQQLFEDTIGCKLFFNATYPDLEVIFLDKYNPMNNFMVRPKLETYLNQERAYTKKVTMFITEGLVMMLLLFWGIIIIYRSFRNELFFKKQQANFLLSITHELKTPLTAMKLYMETLLKRKMDPEQTKTILENSLVETERLQNQVENLLLSAQLENHKYEIQKQSINLSELVTELVNNFNRPRLNEEAVKMDIQDQVVLSADANAIEMILNNLISNGLKYGGNDLTVRLLQNANETKLIVADLGEGIGEEEKKMLFHKFYRIGDENTRKTKGTGLGLFIVKNLVTLHEAKIQVSNNHPKGTIFEINFKSDAE